MKGKYFYLSALFFVLFAQIGFAQQKTITGTVTDSDGIPLLGATVLVLGTTTGTSTDFDGNYSISASANDVLEFSYIGYETVTRNVGSLNTINVTLQPGADVLSEVLVVAYGTQTKESLTGSVGEVKAAEIANITSANVVQGMTGKVAGVQVFSSTGLPGQAPTVRFRGISSISGSSAPLYVVDGVPFTGDVSSINNHDIESMTFLKDAASASLYGNRAANGVIIITTKAAKRTGTNYNVVVNSGFAKRGIPEYNISNDIPEFYEYYYNLLKNDYLYDGDDAATAHAGALGELITGSQGLGYNVTDVADSELITADGRFNPNANILYQEDWKDFLFGSGLYSSTFFNASSKNDDTSLYYSVGYENNETFMVNSRWEKITARFKADSKIGERINVGGNLSYSMTNQNAPDGFDGGTSYSNPFQWTRHIAPIYPVHAYDDNGELIYLPNGDVSYDDGTGRLTGRVRRYGELQNPYATALYDEKKSKAHQIFASGYAGINIIDGLDFKYVVTGEHRGTRSYDMDTPLYGDAVGVNGRLYNSSRNVNSINQQQLLEYNKNFNALDLDVLVGHETYSRDNDFMQHHVTNGLIPNSIYSDMYATLRNARGYGTPYSLESYLGRVNLNYDGRYYFTGSLRRDGSSRFHKDNRWGNFFSVGGSWVISNEDFFQSNLIDFLKLKASYGEVGNDNLGYAFPYLDLYSVVQTPEDVDNISYNQVFKGNKDITWEKNQNFNVGLDLAMLDNRLTLDIEYFNRKTDDLLYMRPLPLSSGFSAMPENIGSMENTGFEVTIDGLAIQNEDVSLNIFANLTSVKNKILTLPETDEGHIIDGSRILKPGGEMYTWYMREWVGVNPENGQSQWVIVDEDTGERDVTEVYSDATLLDTGKSSLPDIYGGFGFNLNVKGFELSTNFAYQLGGYGYDNMWMNFMRGNLAQNFHEDYYNTWTFDDASGQYPLMMVDDPNRNYGTSTLGLIKSDYVSLQNISLGYNFDQSVLDTLGLSSLKLTLNGDNVHVFSKRKGYDPRMAVGGTNSSNFSPISTYSLGLNLTF